MSTVRVQKTQKRMRGKAYTQYIITLPTRDVRALGWHRGTTDLHTMRVGKKGILLHIANYGIPIRKKKAEKTLPLPFGRRYM